MNSTLKGHLAALFTTIVWAMTYISTKVVLRSFSVMDVTFFRIIIAYISLVLFSFIPQKSTSSLSGKTAATGVLSHSGDAASDLPSRSEDTAAAGGLSHSGESVASGTSSSGTVSPKGPSPARFFRHELPFFCAGFFGITAYFLFQNIGMSYTTATNSSIILNTVPLFTALLAWLFLKDRTGIHPLFFLGFVLAMAGIAIISLQDGTASIHLRGDFLILMASVTWGFYTLFTPQINSHGYSSIRVTRRLYFWGMVLMIPAMFYYHFRPDLKALLQPGVLPHLLFLGVIASAVCFVTWNYAIRQLGGVKTNIYVYVQPVVTVIGSALILHEAITPPLLLGIVLSLAGVILSGRPAIGRHKQK